VIDVIIADHQEVFRIGMVEAFGMAPDVCIVSQPKSPEQLLNTLKEVSPQVLILSTNFLAVFSKIHRTLKRHQTALLVLTEEDDRFAYTRWLQAQGVIYRSMNGPALVDVLRRVARGELFVQNRGSDMREDLSAIARGRRMGPRAALDARSHLNSLTVERT